MTKKEAVTKNSLRQNSKKVFFNCADSNKLKYTVPTWQ